MSANDTALKKTFSHTFRPQLPNSDGVRPEYRAVFSNNAGGHYLLDFGRQESVAGLDLPCPAAPFRPPGAPAGDGAIAVVKQRQMGHEQGIESEEDRNSGQCGTASRSTAESANV
jgi:hypothetical protein